MSNTFPRRNKLPNCRRVTVGIKVIRQIQNCFQSQRFAKATDDILSIRLPALLIIGFTARTKHDSCGQGNSPPPDVLYTLVRLMAKINKLYSLMENNMTNIFAKESKFFVSIL